MLILEDDDNYETKFTVSFQGEGILAGEFFVTSREPEVKGENIMKGPWEVEWVDEEVK